MNLEKYNIEFNSTKTSFEFVSEGPKGRILKRIEYSKLEVKGIENLYNLGFGDVNFESNEIDYTVITDNKDSEKVLATVINTIYIFAKYHPEAKIHFEGSNKARTRLYQIAISAYVEDFSETFDVQGYTFDKWFNYEKNVSYEAFLITLKVN
jgi:hypothetical protein